jgi:hypothetical protein
MPILIAFLFLVLKMLKKKKKNPLDLPKMDGKNPIDLHLYKTYMLSFY